MRSRHHFTLMELVTSMAILALVGTVIASTLGIFINSYSNSKKAENALQRNLNIDRAVNTLFAQAVPFTWINTEYVLESESNELVFSGEFDELYLTALGPTLPGKGAFTFARIYLENNNLCADTSPWPLLPWEDNSGRNYDKEILAEKVSQIEFRYAMIDPEDPSRILWFDNWEESCEITGTERPQELPAAISMSCVFEDGTELSWLRRTAAVSATGSFVSGNAAVLETTGTTPSSGGRR